MCVCLFNALRRSVGALQISIIIIIIISLYWKYTIQFALVLAQG